MNIRIPIGPLKIPLPGGELTFRLDPLGTADDWELDLRVDLDNGGVGVVTDVEVNWAPEDIQQFVSGLFTPGFFVIEPLPPKIRVKIGNLVNVQVDIQENPAEIEGVPTELGNFAPGNRVTLVPVSVEKIVRHFLFEVKITDNDKSDWTHADGTFAIKPALSGHDGAVSLEAVNWPNWYFRHFLFALNIAPNDNSQQLKLDASFFFESPGLTGEAGTVSLRAVNYPDRYVNHAPTRLHITKKQDTDDFKQRATFHVRQGLKQ